MRNYYLDKNTVGRVNRNPPKLRFGENMAGWSEEKTGNISGSLGMASNLLPEMDADSSKAAHMVGGLFGGATKGASMGMALGPWGAIGGAVLGGIAGLFKGKKEKERLMKEKAEEEKDKQLRTDMFNRNYASNLLAAYPTQGIQKATFFRKGGDMSELIGAGLNPNTAGGYLKPVSNRAAEVKGDTHEQDTNRDGKTGVMLKDKNNRDMAEVEDGEFIVKLANGKTVVFPSFVTNDEGMPYSEIAKKIEAQKIREENAYIPNVTKIADYEKALVSLYDEAMQKSEQYAQVLGSQDGTAPAQQPQGQQMQQPALPQAAQGIGTGVQQMRKGGEIPKYRFGNESYRFVSELASSNKYFDFKPEGQYREPVEFMSKYGNTKSGFYNILNPAPVTATLGPNGKPIILSPSKVQFDKSHKIVNSVNNASNTRTWKNDGRLPDRAIDTELNPNSPLNTKAEVGGGIEVPIKAKANLSDKMSTAANQFTNVADILYNQRLTKTMPKSPMQDYMTNVKLDTNVNVNPQIQEVKGGIAATRKMAEMNTADGQTAAVIGANAIGEGIGKVNEILSKKEMAETELKNTEIMANKQVEQSNIETKFQNDTSKYLDRMRQRGEQSANVAKLRDRYMQQDYYLKQQNMDVLALNTVLSAYDNNPAALRNDFESLAQAYGNTKQGAMLLRSKVINSKDADLIKRFNAAFKHMPINS